MTSPPQAHPAVPAGNDAPVPPARSPAKTSEGASAPGPSEWRRAWILSLALFTAASAVLIWVFWGEAAAAVHVWSTSSTFGHGFLILPIVAFLFYRLRHRLAVMTPKAAPLALVPVIGLTLLWMVADLANVMVVRQFAFIGLWQAIFLLIMGWQVTWACLFPLAYLFLAVPLGSEIIPQLQDITAHIVVQLLRLTGMPVFLDGYYIQIPSGSFLVAEACSGLRFLIVCLALGILVAHLFFRSWAKRLFFVGLCVIVPIIANGMRAYGIIILAHLSDYRLAADVDHIVYGFIFLSIIILVLIGLAALMRDREGSLDNPPEPAAAQPAPRAPAAWRQGAQAFFTCLALGVVVLAHSWTASAKAPPPGGLSVTLQPPAAQPPWSAETAPAAAGWQATFNNSDATLHQSYRDDERQVDLHIGYYAYQREGAEAASEANKLVDDGSAWQVRERRPTVVRLGETTHPIIRLLISHKGEVYLAWYWYRIGGERTNSRLMGKVLEMKAMATGGERSASVVAIAAKVSDDVAAAEALLGDFLQNGVTDNGSLVLHSGPPPHDAPDPDSGN